MKINENFLLREVAGNAVVVPVGEASDRFNGMIKLNETAAFIWRVFEEDREVSDAVDALCGTYGVDRETAERDVLALIETLRRTGILDN